MPLKEVKKDTVCLLMPCGGPVEPRVVQSSLNLVTHSARAGYPVIQIGITDRTLVQLARNMLAEAFLKETEAEWAFWMDSDMILEDRTIRVMMQYAKQLNTKMLTGIYYKRLGDHQPVLWRKKLQSTNGEVKHDPMLGYSHYVVYPNNVGGKPFLVDVAGFGCTLIHRDVFDKMKWPYFKFVPYEEGGKHKEASEDFYFFVQAGELGYRLWAVPELDCGHVGMAPIIRHKDMKMDKAKMTEMNLTAPGYLPEKQKEVV